MIYQKLSPRLAAALKSIPHSRMFADIGSDHAYLAIAALETGRADSAIAADLREGPLSRAKQNGVSWHGRLSYALSDGFDALDTSAIDTAAICGMGGETMADILSRADLKNTYLILQPQTFAHTVRKWLWDNGFETEKEAFVTDSGRAYCVICAHYSGYRRAYDASDCRFGIIRPKNGAFDMYIKAAHTDLSNRLKAGDDRETQLLCRECEVMLKKPHVILASASPRRRDILDSMHITYDVCPSPAEKAFDASLPRADAMCDIALSKAEYIAKEHPSSPVIAADTMVFACDGTPLGKPKDEKDAFRMLKSLSGKPNTVSTGVCIISGGVSRTFCCDSVVMMRDYSDSEIYDYIATKEPLDKAGAYALQGIGRRLVDSFGGSLTNIIGLPRAELAEALCEII